MSAPINTQALAAQLRPILTRLVRKLRRLSLVGNMLSPGERSVLVLLDRDGPLLSAELASMEKITPQSMGQILNRLDKLDLVSKAVSANDKRKIFISLSEKGNEMIKKVRSERDGWLSKAISEVCTEEEQMALQEALKPLTKLVDFE